MRLQMPADSLLAQRLQCRIASGTAATECAMVDSSMTLTATRADRQKRDTGSASAEGKPTLARRYVEGTYTVARVHLECGNALRVRDGQSTVVRALSGVLWITEERSMKDTVLLPGDVHRIENQGITLLLAHRASRVVLEIADGDSSPRMLEVAMRDGDPQHRLPVPRGRLSQRRPIAAAIAIVRGTLSSAMRALSRCTAFLGAAERREQPEGLFRVPYY